MVRQLSAKLTCDVCGTTKNVRSYTIVAPEGAAVLDLCTGDSKPLMDLWHQGSTEPRKKETGDRRPGSGHAVIPVD